MDQTVKDAGAAKPIWFGEQAAMIMQKPPMGIVARIGIELIEFGGDYLKGRMPVDDRTHQPFGLLHGGASVVLAETLASMASYATVDPAKKMCVGLEINANHLRGVTSGWVTGIARPIHLGRTTQVWDIRLTDDTGRPTCISRCTMAVIDAPAAKA
jgi:1,4-dihydroxy-2-naphthoyl-CoA hydrolase